MSLPLRLEDPHLEAAYWRQPLTAGGARADLACCLVVLCLQVVILRLNARESSRASPSQAPAGIPFPGLWLMTALSATHAAAICFARAFYARRRTRLQAGMRLARLGFIIYISCVAAAPAARWRPRMLRLAAAAPGRALGASLLAVPATFLMHGLMNPCPLALHPLLAAASLAASLGAWAPVGCGLWSHPLLAQEARKAAARLAAVMDLVDSSAITAFGAPLGAAAAACAPGAPGGAGDGLCVAPLATLALTMQVVSLAIPAYIAWRSELAGKRRFLQARGRRLRVRAAALEWLASQARARGLSVAPRPGAALALPAAAAAPLLVWQLSGLLLRVFKLCGV
ncbi:MAG: hypothetical protein J3K34DRAFT_526380 [Monoraphidium minutum]|nr:MAG: hypothetical protein J3K34DRAFT_526380 [Monoraphidium minutum]